MTEWLLFKKICWRELLIQSRQLRFIINALMFFLMMLFVFPLTLKPEVSLLRMAAPGVIWMTMLLSLLLSVDRLFQQDYEQGVMEQWLVSGLPLPIMVLAKLLATWLFFVPVVLIVAFLAGAIFSFSLWETWILLTSLFCGMPCVLFLCALAAAFGAGVSQKGALMALIVLPLTLPILIFGSGTLNMAMQGFPVSGNLALLLAMSLGSATVLPYAISAVIRVGLVE